MRKIVKGDKLRVVSELKYDASSFSVGDIVIANTNEYNGFVDIINGSYKGGGWLTERFEIVESELAKPENSIIDFSKPVQTKDGRKVEIISTNGRGVYPVVGYVGDNIHPWTFTLEGENDVDAPGFLTLENVPEAPKKVVRYVNFNSNESIGGAYKSRAIADEWAAHNRASCQRVVFTEGVFDE